MLVVANTFCFSWFWGLMVYTITYYYNLLQVVDVSPKNPSPNTSMTNTQRLTTWDVKNPVIRAPQFSEPSTVPPRRVSFWGLNPFQEPKTHNPWRSAKWHSACGSEAPGCWQHNAKCLPPKRSHEVKLIIFDQLRNEEYFPIHVWYSGTAALENENGKHLAGMETLRMSHGIIFRSNDLHWMQCLESLELRERFWQLGKKRISKHIPVDLHESKYASSVLSLKSEHCQPELCTLRLQNHNASCIWNVHWNLSK